jgi:hypothetical protein
MGSRAPSVEASAACGLALQTSASSPCVFNRSWGCETNSQAASVWISHGCRGWFTCTGGQEFRCGWPGMRTVSKRMHCNCTATNPPPLATLECNAHNMTQGSDCRGLHLRAGEVVRQPNRLAVGNSVILSDRAARSESCQHDLFRIPKTGSTALANALFTDAALVSHVCTPRFVSPLKHDRPRPGHPRGIVVTLREPLARWMSVERSGMVSHSLMYSPGNLTDFNLLAQHYRNPKNWYSRGSWLLQASYVLPSPRVRPDGTLTPKDVYLCISEPPGVLHDAVANGDGTGSNSSEVAVQLEAIHVQLRNAFADKRIAPIPIENVNHAIEHGRDAHGQIIVWPSESSKESLRRGLLRFDYEVWNHHCAGATRAVRHQTNRAPSGSEKTSAQK